VTQLLHYTEVEIEQFGTTVKMDTEFSFDTADPYAVKMSFHDPAGELIEWSVAREIMFKGMTEMSGGMDVQFWPTGVSKTHTAISLNNPEEGDALLAVRTSEIKAFLKKTEELLPMGQEEAICQAELESWLANIQEENP